MTRPEGSRDETADKLIHAGIELFGEHGFAGTTTRMVAEAAHSNIGSIAYYFGNKRGLYLACAGHIAARMRQIFLLDVSTENRDWLAGLNKQQARVRLEQMVRRMVRLFSREEEARRWLMLVMREQANPSEAFDVLYREAFEVAHVTLTTLIGVVTGRDPTERRVILEAHTLVGQIVFFLVGRTPLLRRLNCGDHLPEAIAAEAEEVVVAHLAALGRAS